MLQLAVDWNEWYFLNKYNRFTAYLLIHSPKVKTFMISRHTNINPELWFKLVAIKLRLCAEANP